MHKTIISEINRQREMMGLSILVEQDFSDDKEFASWLATQNTSVLADMTAAFSSNDGMMTYKSKMDVVSFLRKTYEDMGVRGIGSGFKSREFGSVNTKDVKINLVNGGAAVMSDCCGTGGRGFRSGEPMSLWDICELFNQYNFDNFGKSQIVALTTQKGRPSVNIPRMQKKKRKEGMYVWSAIKGSYGYEADAGRDAIAGTPDIVDVRAGAELEPIIMGDAFADFAVEPNKSDLQNAQAELESIEEAGGAITRIAITSTATATGISEDGEETFVNTMNSAGFPKYAEITNFTQDTDIGEFSEMEVTSADRALAVARGKYLAKSLGFDDSQVDYTFSLVKGVKGGPGKVVNLVVSAQGEDEEIVLQKGTDGQSGRSASGSETLTQSGPTATLTRYHINIR